MSSTASASDTDNIQVYSSILYPQYATEDYYTITIDRVGRKATLEYTFLSKTEEMKFISLHLYANVVVRTNIDGKVYTNSKGVTICNNSFNNKDSQKTVTIVYDFSEKAIKEYEAAAIPNGNGAAATVETYTLTDLSSSPKVGGEFCIKDGKLSFTPNHSHEEKLITHLKKDYKPTDYKTFTQNDYAAYNKTGFLNTLQDKVKEITAGCNSDVEKYFAIHDWICNNISYDWMAFDIIKGKLCPSNSDELISIATNPEKVYKYKRAICEGYSRFGSLMLRAAGIPAMYISGIAYSHGGDECLENTYYTDDDSRIHSNEKAHAWNALYVGGKWMLTDFTWDSDGEYHGDNSPENVNSRMRYRRWGNRSCGDFGSEHISFFGPNGRLDYTKNDPFKDNKDDKKENTLDAVKINKVTSLKNGISLSWKKRADITGYEIQCSKNKKFTSIDRVMKVPVSKTTAKITKLKKKTIYYVRIHVYKKYGNQELSGAWSSVKKVKTN